MHNIRRAGHLVNDENERKIMFREMRRKQQLLSEQKRCDTTIRTSGRLSGNRRPSIIVAVPLSYAIQTENCFFSLQSRPQAGQHPKK